MLQESPGLQKLSAAEEMTRAGHRLPRADFILSLLSLRVPAFVGPYLLNTG
jgi:hypothetical protein